MHRYFGVVSAAVAIVSICLVSASPTTTTESPPKDLGRLVIAYELLVAHVCSTTNAPMKQLNTELSESLLPTTIDYDWNARFIPKNKGIQLFEGDRPDELETAAISKLDTPDKKVGEVWHNLPDGSWKLVSTVRANPTCYHCHENRGVAKIDLHAHLGYASITLTKKVKNK